MRKVLQAVIYAYYFSSTLYATSLKIEATCLFELTVNFQDMLFCLFALLPFFFQFFKYSTKMRKIKGGYMYIIFQGPIIQIMISMD